MGCRRPHCQDAQLVGHVAGMTDTTSANQILRVCCLWRRSTMIRIDRRSPGSNSESKSRTNFKVAILVHRSLSGNSASYLADDCRLVADARERRLRSTESRTCVVTRTHSTYGDRAFATADSGLWNSLPPDLRDADLPYSGFRLSLKSFLFG